MKISICKTAFPLLICLMSLGCQQSQPGITDIKIGPSNDDRAYVSQQTPITARIKSDAPLSRVETAIHPETEGGWEFAEQYNDKIENATAVDFSATIDIPSTAKPGKYALTLKAIKNDGAAIEASQSFTIAIDSSLPTVSDLDIGVNAAKDDLHLGAELSAAKKIRQVTIAIKGGAWSKDIVIDGPKVNGKLSHHFHEHAHIDEAPQGTYEVVVTVEDQDGRKATNQGTFTK